LTGNQEFQQFITNAERQSLQFSKAQKTDFCETWEGGRMLSWIRRFFPGIRITQKVGIVKNLIPF